MPNTLDIQNKLNTSHSSNNTGPASKSKKRILALARKNQYLHSVDIKAVTLFQPAPAAQPKVRTRGKTLHQPSATMETLRIRSSTL